MGEKEEENAEDKGKTVKQEEENKGEGGGKERGREETP